MFSCSTSRCHSARRSASSKPASSSPSVGCSVRYAGSACAARRSGSCCTVRRKVVPCDAPAIRMALSSPGARWSFWTDRNRSEEHTSELQSQSNLVCRLLLEKKKRCNMVRMVGGSLLRGVGVVGDLLSQGELPVRDAPVPQAVHSMFAMKLQVVAVPPISVVRTPDLDAGPRVPRKDRDFPLSGRGERVRLIRRKSRSVPSRIETTLFETVLVSADRRAPGDEVRIHEEESDPVTTQQLLEPGTEPGSCRARGTGPDVTRAVGALRKPDPAGTSPEASAVPRDAGGELRVDRFLATQQRQGVHGGSPTP